MPKHGETGNFVALSAEEPGRAKLIAGPTVYICDEHRSCNDITLKSATTMRLDGVVQCAEASRNQTGIRSIRDYQEREKDLGWPSITTTSV
jgi:hypothetical protein